MLREFARRSDIKLKKKSTLLKTISDAVSNFTDDLLQIAKLEDEGDLDAADQISLRIPDTLIEPYVFTSDYSGSYIISVALKPGCYRHIKISAKASLYELSSAILDAFNFYDDHHHAFFMDNIEWSDRDAYFSDVDEDFDDYDRKQPMKFYSATFWTSK